MQPRESTRISSGDLIVNQWGGVISWTVHQRWKGGGGETMRPDANRSKVILALKQAIEATFDEGKWLELGYMVGKEEMISRHPRLLRSLE